jgi:hypothetical protein
MLLAAFCLPPSSFTYEPMRPRFVTNTFTRSASFTLATRLSYRPPSLYGLHHGPPAKPHRGADGRRVRRHGLQDAHGIIVLSIES